MHVPFAYDTSLVFWVYKRNELISWIRVLARDHILNPEYAITNTPSPTPPAARTSLFGIGESGRGQNGEKKYRNSRMAPGLGSSSSNSQRLAPSSQFEFRRGILVRSPFSCNLFMLYSKSLQVLVLYIKSLSGPCSKQWHKHQQ